MEDAASAKFAVFLADRVGEVWLDTDLWQQVDVRNAASAKFAAFSEDGAGEVSGDAEIAATAKVTIHLPPPKSRVYLPQA